MDIGTHALIGLIGAAPVMQHAPLPAAAFALGSVAPDIDALSRVFGKRAFIYWHQTHTHGLFTILVAGTCAGLGAGLAGPDGWGVALGLVLGMTLHSLLDASNTLGVALLAPLSRRRFCLEWVFFIDLFVATAALVAAGLSLPGIMRSEPVTPVYAGVFTLALGGYWIIKGWLRRRAGRLAPQGTVSLIPSALWPWHFLGCRQVEAEATLFRLNAWNGKVSQQQPCALYDEQFASELAAVPEYALMRTMSPAYHVIDVLSTASGRRLVCRDLRIRNFQTRFGDLEVSLRSDGSIQEIEFHV